MIKKEELMYIGRNANSIPYPGDDYAYEAINRLSYALALYSKKYENKNFNVLLSNNEDLVFEINKDNLASLFGIDYKKIFTDESLRPLLYSVLGFCGKDKLDSFTLLQKIIENANDVIRNDEINSNKLLNYYRIMSKTTCFIRLKDFDKFNFGVMDFNKTRYELVLGNRYTPEATKYLLFPIDEELIPFCLMGLVNNQDTNTMMPETFITPESVKHYLLGQELLLPKGLLIDGKYDINRITATNEEKKRILNLCKSIILSYKTHSSIRLGNRVIEDPIKKRNVR